MKKNIYTYLASACFLFSSAIFTSCDNTDDFAKEPSSIEGETEVEEDSDNKPVMVNDTLIRKDTLTVNSANSDSLSNKTRSEAPEPDSAETKPTKKIYKPVKYYMLRHKTFVTEAESAQKRNDNKKDVYYGNFDFVPDEVTWEHYSKQEKAGN